MSADSAGSVLFLLVLPDRVPNFITPRHQSCQILLREFVTGGIGGHLLKDIPKVVVGIYSIQLCSLDEGINYGAGGCSNRPVGK